MEASAPRGFVYVATGDRYRGEAAVSAARLRQVHPGERICLVTDRAAETPFWDDLVLLEQPIFGLRDKIWMHRCPYADFIFLDTDTHVVAPLDEVFQLLEHFDGAGHQLFEGHDSPIPGVPDAFPEFNTGVLAFRRSPAVAALFEDWRRHYDAFRAPDRPDRDVYANVTDQKSFRLAVYASRLRIAILGPEYNFTPANVNLACATVRVLHGRGDDFTAFAERINAQLGGRVYHPTLDVILQVPTRGPELRRLWLRATAQLLRRVGVACTPLALRNALRRSRGVRHFFLGGRFGP